MVKLNTSCVQNVVAIERGRLGRASPGTDAEDSFFQEPVTLTPTWMRSMGEMYAIDAMCSILIPPSVLVYCEKGQVSIISETNAPPVVPVHRI